MEFFRFAGEDGNDQHTTARFYLPPVTSDDDELNLLNVVTELEGKIDAFSGRNSGWTVAQIKYFRLCWGSVSTYESRILFTNPEIYFSFEGRFEYSKFHRSRLFTILRFGRTTSLFKGRF